MSKGNMWYYGLSVLSRVDPTLKGMSRVRAIRREYNKKYPFTQNRPESLKRCGETGILGGKKRTKKGARHVVNPAGTKLSVSILD